MASRSLFRIKPYMTLAASVLRTSCRCTETLVSQDVGQWEGEPYMLRRGREMLLRLDALQFRNAEQYDKEYERQCDAIYTASTGQFTKYQKPTW